MRIALDGMGGDIGPGVLVEGAALALKKKLGPEVELVLVGRLESLQPLLADLSASLRGRISIKPASQVAGMDDSPSRVLRRLTDSSIRVCFDLMAAGEVQAVVSAGNSGATMAVGMVVSGRLPEVERPALASIFPGVHGDRVLIDVGANVDCPPLMLLQFGYMGSVYAEVVLGVERPTVGLLNIGEEDTKGNSAVKQAHEYFKNSALNFLGNVEGRDLFSGTAQVVVCDGFVGNICLKLTEGLAQGLNTAFLDELDSTLVGRAGVKMLRGKLRAFRRRIDYASYGGAPLLGINGVAFVCHGASTPEAIATALGAAADSVSGELVEHLKEGLNRYRGLLLGQGAAD